jgi:RNA polymerase sigma factor (sigma-70 family)
MDRRPLRTVVQHLRRIADPQGHLGLSDAELLERFLTNRDDAAFEVLVWRHGAMVLGLCQRILRHTQDAEDAFQATFLTLARKADSIGKRESLGSWLHKVAYRVAVTARSSAARRASREQRGVEGVSVEPATDLLWRDLRPVLDEEIDRLPDSFRVPFVMCYLEGKTHEEIARQLGCAVGTVESRLGRARRRLKGQLTRRGLTLAAGALAVSLPEQTTAATVSASLVGAAVQTVAGVVSTRVIALAEGVIQAMALPNFKGVTCMFALVGVLAAGAGLFIYPGRAAQPTGPARVALLGTQQGKDVRPVGAPGGGEKEGPTKWQERRSLKRNGSGVTAIAFSPDGKTCAVGDEDGTVTFWDPTTGKLTNTIKTQYPHVWACAFSPDGQTLAVATWEKQDRSMVELFNATTLKSRGVFASNEERYLSVAFSPDGKLLAIAGTNKKVYLWESLGKLKHPDAFRWRQRTTLEGHNSEIDALAFSPDGKALVSATGNLMNWGVRPGEVKLWEVATGKERRELQQHPEAVTAVAFSPDGKMLLTGCADHQARLWDPVNGKLLKTLSGHKGFVLSVAFNPDGRTVATGSRDETVKLWDANTGKEAATLEGHQGEVAAVAFAHRGRLLASGNLSLRFTRPDSGEVEVKLWERVKK